MRWQQATDEQVLRRPPSTTCYPYPHPHPHTRTCVPAAHSSCGVAARGAGAHAVPVPHQRAQQRSVRLRERRAHGAPQRRAARLRKGARALHEGGVGRVGRVRRQSRLEALGEQRDDLRKQPKKMLFLKTFN